MVQHITFLFKSNQKLISKNPNTNKANQTKSNLLVLLQSLPIGGLDNKLGREDVRELRTIAIPPTSGLLHSIIVIATRQQVPENQLRHVHLLLLVNLHRHSISIVLHADPVLLDVDYDLQRVHLRVPLLVIRRIDQDLVENLVQTRDEGDRPVDHAAVGLVDPERLRVLLYGADVGVRPEEDVLEL